MQPESGHALGGLNRREEGGGKREEGRGKREEGRRRSAPCIALTCWFNTFLFRFKRSLSSFWLAIAFQKEVMEVIAAIETLWR